MAENEEQSDLRGKVALITGGARRVGGAIARRLHADGANICVHYRSSAAEAEALVAELNTRRAGSACCQAADLLANGTADGLIASVLGEWGRLDLLVNNASSFYATPVGRITAADWDDLLGTNLKAPLFLSQAATPALRSAQGSIINIVDIHGLRPLRDHPVYCVAKAGLAMLTRALARDLGPEIRVNGIAPGPVLWPDAGIDEPLKREIVKKTALKRRGSPADIARTALFLAKDAPYVTGQIIAVDGGRGI
ncbi:MAG: pteridine reductase [Steroidobacteraceae bacterium]|nr:pteridine reductase [Steroidobacteraceae bacterium]